MTQAAYTVSDSPADVEAAALDLIVRLPGHIIHTDALAEVLQDYCGALRAEGGPGRRASGMRLPASPPFFNTLSNRRSEMRDHGPVDRRISVASSQ